MEPSGQTIRREEGEDQADSTVVVVDSKIQSILDLLDRHVAGEATNQEVEQAVSLLLNDTDAAKKDDGNTHHTMNSTTTNISRQGVAKAQEDKEIDQDMENYDEDGGDSKLVSTDPTVKTVASPRSPACSSRKRRMGTKPYIVEKEPSPFDRSLYDGIPLGYQGARMMTTFGDGKKPLPEAVQATLKGVRKMLQVAIQDARYIRRRHRQIYASAQRSVGVDNRVPKEMKDVKFEFSTEVLFQATEGHDPLAKDHKCGFAIGDLQILFPEELNEYMRWSAMNAETEAAKHSSNAIEVVTAVEEEKAEEFPISQEEQAIKDGHLQERAAQFDVRTHRMPDSWYLTYSELRQGSFLPRQRRGPKQPASKNNSQVGSGWGKLKLQAIRFLHWCGFDPESPLPPPNEDTVDALAFLGYDFVGRIVEKAIAIRKYGDREGKVPRHEQLLELENNQQLTAQDIEKAMAKLNPVPLYSSEPDMKGVKAHPLYFGPGFEKRLEMEIEEFMLDRKLSPEEQQLRQQEDEFFANLTSRVDLFPDPNDDPILDKAPTTKRKRRKSS